jgi:hypothetical protein
MLFLYKKTAIARKGGKTGWLASQSIGQRRDDFPLFLHCDEKSNDTFQIGRNCYE